MSKPLIFAHRGVKGTHPENTMIAFQEAERIGAHGIELDVHLSKDGELVVIHDETVDRTTNGIGLVSEKTVEELQALDAGSHKDASFHEAKIPTLREVFIWLSTTNFQLLTKEFVQLAQKQGYVFRPYTINEYKDLQTMLDYGVDVIITDWPARAFELLS